MNGLAFMLALSAGTGFGWVLRTVKAHEDAENTWCAPVVPLRPLHPSQLPPTQCTRRTALRLVRDTDHYDWENEPV